MSFETPAALWGLSALLLLALFSLWRQAAVRITVPSLSLWKRIPERNPPIRALRRPAWRWELLFYALAIAAAVGGLAGPYVELDRPKPRRIGIVMDTSARMRDRLGRMVERARELRKGPLAGDRVTFYGADPSPRPSEDPGVFRIVDVHVDVEPLLKLARAENERVVLFSDRAPEGVEAELFGGPPANVGIVDFAVTDGEIFARLANHGAARNIRARIAVDDLVEELDIDLPAGERGWWRKGDYTRAQRVELVLRTDDGFPTDDVAGASRSEAAETAVAVAGRDVPLLRRALAAVPGVVLRDGPAVVSVGVDADPPPASFRVRLHVPSTPRQAVVVRTPHPLTEGLRESELSSVGELPEAGGAVLLRTSEGAPVAALKGEVLHVALGMSPEGWPGTPSFPIFWANVIQFARRGRATFATARTGVPFTAAVPPDPPAGAIWTSGADGTFLAHTAGDYGPLRVNLLDSRETDAGGRTGAAAWEVGVAGRAKERRSLGGGAAGLALGCLLVAWMLQRRTD